MTSCVAGPSPSRKGLSSLLLIGVRLRWKHRNNIMFKDEAPSLECLLNLIIGEARLYRIC